MFFKKYATITAGNSSGLNDAVAIIIGKDKAEELDLKPLSKIIEF